MHVKIDDPDSFNCVRIKLNGRAIELVAECCEQSGFVVVMQKDGREYKAKKLYGNVEILWEGERKETNDLLCNRCYPMLDLGIGRESIYEDSDYFEFKDDFWQFKENFWFNSTVVKKIDRDIFNDGGLQLLKDLNFDLYKQFLKLGYIECVGFVTGIKYRILPERSEQVVEVDSINPHRWCLDAPVSRIDLMIIIYIMLTSELEIQFRNIANCRLVQW